MFRVITSQSTTDPIDLPLGTLLDVLAGIAHDMPDAMVVVDLDRRELATVHPDGGIDFTPDARQYR